MRYPREQDKIMLKEQKCDIDYGIVLLFKSGPKYKQTLMQGFEGVEHMIQRLRNGTEHKDDKDGLKILKKKLNRTVEDPISHTQTFGNIITLCSVLTLCSYQFDEIIQTWIDTNTFVKNTN